MFLTVRSQRLLELSQGADSVAEFSIRIHTLAREAGWDEKAQRGAFLKALNDPLKDELVTRDDALLGCSHHPRRQTRQPFERMLSGEGLPSQVTYR